MVNHPIKEKSLTSITPPPLPTPLRETPQLYIGDRAYPAFTIALVVMNSAIPGFFATGSGTGPAGVGCIAGAETVNSAGNGVPLIRIAFPFFVVIVLFRGSNVTETVPTPGVTNGGDVYGIGALSVGGSSSPSRQTGIFITVMSVLVPISGAGAINIGTTAGGNMVIRIMSPVLIT
jgi:hypothetical protein